MKVYAIVFRDNLLELATSTLFLSREVAVQVMKTHQSFNTRELDVQPLDVDRRTEVGEVK